MAFHFLSRAVPQYICTGIGTGGKKPRECSEMNIPFRCKPCSGHRSSLGCFISLYSRKRILTQTVCRAASAVQTAQPQYVASNCFVKHMHQLYLFASKLWEPHILLRKFSFYIDIKNLTVLSDVPCHTKKQAANPPQHMKLFRFTDEIISYCTPKVSTSKRWSQVGRATLHPFRIYA